MLSGQRSFKNSARRKLTARMRNERQNVPRTFGRPCSISSSSAQITKRVKRCVLRTSKHCGAR